MKRYKRPTREDFYNQFITLNKTNKQLSEHYGCSENVIHRWKKYYKLTKPLELVLKSYVHKGWEKGHATWNKGMKGILLGEGSKKTWFTRDRIIKKSKNSVGKPREDGKNRLICLCEEREPKKSNNGKIYQSRKRIGYAQYVLKQAGIEIPKGYIVYHIDGNYANNDIGNLEIISRAELMKRNHSASILAKKGYKTNENQKHRRIS